MSYIECPVTKTMLIKSLYTAFIDDYAPNYRFVGEAHDFWELVVVIDGELGVCAGKRILTLHRGEAILHKPMEFHRLWSENKTSPRVLIISFDAEIIPKLPKRLFCIPDDFLCELVDFLSQLREPFETGKYRIKSILPDREIDAELAIKALEGKLLIMFSKYGKNSAMDFENQSKHAQLFEEIVIFLENNLDKKLTLEDVADGCAISRSNLKKIFAKYSGIGVISYFNVMKVRAAKKYLSQGMTVRACAIKLGFTDQYYFSTVFKRITSEAPSFYSKD